MGIGGIETGVRDIAKYLNKKKIKNYILCESSNKNLNTQGIKLIRLNNLKFKNIFDQTKIKKIIKELIIKKKINVVHISSRAPAFFLIGFIKKLDIKVVTSVHNKYQSESLLKDWYNNFLLKGDAVIFNSNFVKKSYKVNSYQKNKIFIIPRGIDINFFYPSKKKLSHKFIFLPSRVSRWKGHDLLITYFALIDQKYKNLFKIHLISSNQSKEEKKINKLVKELGLSKNVVITKPTLKINKLYHDSFLVVNLSKRPEGFGRTISEALSSAKPIIAPNQGGTKEQLYHFDKKLLFNVNSYSSFLRAFEYVIKNYQLISKKGRKFVKKNYSSDLMCKKTLEVYNYLVNQ